MSRDAPPDPRADVPFADDVRATSDRMLELLEELRDTETDKRQHPIGSPEFVARAERAEQLSRLIFRWSQMQGAMAEDAAMGGAPGPSVESVAPRPIHRLLADWREAELRLVAAKPGSEEAAAATDAIERIREEYAELMRRQLGHERQRVDRY